MEESNAIILTVTGSNTAVITSLAPWTQYTVTVQPFNGLYLGPHSNEGRAMTGSDGKLPFRSYSMESVQIITVCFYRHWTLLVIVKD